MFWTRINIDVRTLLYYLLLDQVVALQFRPYSSWGGHIDEIDQTEESEHIRDVYFRSSTSRWVTGYGRISRRSSATSFSRRSLIDNEHNRNDYSRASTSRRVTGSEPVDTDYSHAPTSRGVTESNLDVNYSRSCAQAYRGVPEDGHIRKATPEPSDSPRLLENRNLNKFATQPSGVSSRLLEKHHLPGLTSHPSSICSRLLGVNLFENPPPCASTSTDVEAERMNPCWLCFEWIGH